MWYLLALDNCCYLSYHWLAVLSIQLLHKQSSVGRNSVLLGNPTSVVGFHGASTNICPPQSAADWLFHILGLCNLVLSLALSALSHEAATRFQN